MLILDQCNGKIKLITHLCCPFRTNCRSNHQRCSMKKGVLRNFPKSTGKPQCQSLFLVKLQTWGLKLYLKKRLWHRCFRELCEISKNNFFTEHLWTTASIITWIFTHICIVIVNTKFVGQRRIENHAKYLRWKVLWKSLRVGSC